MGWGAELSSPEFFTANGKRRSPLFLPLQHQIPGIVGLASVTQTNLVDPSQFNPESKYFDPKATSEKPRWYTVAVGYQETFAEIITLDQLKASFTPEEFAVVRRGNRLSVMPVPETVAERLLAMVS